MVSDGNRLGHPGNPEAPDHTATRARGIGSPGRQAVILAIVFLSLLTAAIGTTVWMSDRIGDAPMDRNGYIALAIGVTATLALGMGLMGLLFYSSRHGYDEGARRQ